MYESSTEEEQADDEVEASPVLFEANGSKKRKISTNFQMPNLFENPHYNSEILRQIRAEQMKDRESRHDERTTLKRDGQTYWEGAKRVKAADMMPRPGTRFLPSFVHEIKTTGNGLLTPKQLVERRLTAEKRTRRGEVSEPTYVVEYPNGIRTMTPLTRELAAKYGYLWIENEETIRNGVGLRVGVRNLGHAAVDAFRELAGEPPEDEIESLPDDGPIYINADESSGNEDDENDPLMMNEVRNDLTSKLLHRRSNEFTERQRRWGKKNSSSSDNETSDEEESTDSYKTASEEDGRFLDLVETCDREYENTESEESTEEANEADEETTEGHQSIKTNESNSTISFASLRPSRSASIIQSVDPEVQRCWQSIRPIQMTPIAVEGVNPMVMPTNVAHPFDSRVMILTTLPLNDRELNLRPITLSAPPRRNLVNATPIVGSGSFGGEIVPAVGVPAKPKFRRYSNIAAPRPGHLNASTDTEWRHHETTSLMEHLPPPFAPRRMFERDETSNGSWRVTGAEDRKCTTSYSSNRPRMFTRQLDMELTNRLSQWRHGTEGYEQTKYTENGSQVHFCKPTENSSFLHDTFELKSQGPSLKSKNKSRESSPSTKKQLMFEYKNQFEHLPIEDDHYLNDEYAEAENPEYEHDPQFQEDVNEPPKTQNFTALTSVIDFDPFGDLPGDDKLKRRSKNKQHRNDSDMNHQFYRSLSPDYHHYATDQDLPYTTLQLDSPYSDLPDAFDYKERSINRTYVPPAFRHSNSVDERSNGSQACPQHPSDHFDPQNSNDWEQTPQRKSRPSHPFTTILNQTGQPHLYHQRPHSAPPYLCSYRAHDDYSEFVQTFDIHRRSRRAKFEATKKVEEEEKTKGKQSRPDTYFSHLDETMNVPRLRNLFEQSIVHPLCHLYRHPAYLPKNSIFWSGEDPNFVWTRQELCEAINLLADRLELFGSLDSDQVIQLGRLVTLERAMKMLKNAAKSLDLTPRIAPHVKMYSREFAFALRQFYCLLEEEDEDNEIWYKLLTSWERKTDNSFVEYLNDGLDAMEYVQRIDNQGCCMEGCETEVPSQPCTVLDRYNHFMYNPGFDSYSRKVFVGGVPSDVDEEAFLQTFRRFGKLTADWPSRTDAPTRSQQTTYYTSSNKSRSGLFDSKTAILILLVLGLGYVFLIYSEERSVHLLRQACIVEDGQYFMPISGVEDPKRMVQVRPWLLSEADFLVDPFMRINLRFAVFIGGVPRPIRASELAHTMNVLYGNVVMAGIDTDLPLKYPKGAGRVVFSDFHSYMRAISDRFVRLHHGDIDKIVEIKPYVLDDQRCDECHGYLTDQPVAPFFCPSPDCLQYYCENCWSVLHANGRRAKHRPLVKEA